MKTLTSSAKTTINLFIHYIKYLQEYHENVGLPTPTLLEKCNLATAISDQKYTAAISDRKYPVAISDGNSDQEFLSLIETTFATEFIFGS